MNIVYSFQRYLWPVLKLPSLIHLEPFNVCARMMQEMTAICVASSQAMP